MLTDIVLACDGKHPQVVSFEDIFDYHGKKKLARLKSLSAKADANAMSLAYLGDMFPRVQVLRLDNSVIPSIRELSTELSFLRTLSLTHCGLTELDGIQAVCQKVQELYLGFNQIDNLSELLGLHSLKVLSVEHNRIPYVEDVEILKCCRSLKRLVLRGNGAEEHPEYRAEIKRLVPRLVWLDDVRFGCEDVPSKPEPEPEPAPALAPLSADAFCRPPRPLPRLRGTETAPVSRLVTRQRPTALKIPRVVVPVARPTAWHNVGPARL